MISRIRSGGRWLKRVRLHIPLLMLTLLFASLLPATPTPARGQSPTPEAKNLIFLPFMADTRPYCKYQPAKHVFGVQMYGRTTPQSLYYNFLVESRAAWVRLPLSWRDVEPENTTPDKYDWRQADNIVGAATYRCLEVILTIDNAPQWAADYSRGPVPENMHAEFAQFLAALVERYDGDGKDDAPGKPHVNYIELYNEPDSATPPPLSTWGRSGALYAKLLIAATPKMRQANPNVKVLLGGIAYERFTTDEDPGNFIETFVNDVIAGGGAPYFDYMNFHYYPSFASRWVTQGPLGPGLLEKTAILRKKLAELDVNKPFMITETGWHSNADPDQPSNDEDQMRYVVQLLTQAKVADIKAVIYFRLNDPSLTNPGESSQYHTGIVTSDDPPVKKKSFTTYQMVVEVLGPADFERTLPLNVTNASDMQAYEFTDSAGNMRIYVAWLNPIHTSATKPLVLPGEQATVRNVRNVTTGVLDESDGQDDGKLTFEISARPIIIEIPN